MKIYDQKILDVYVHGKLQTVSVHELFQLIADGFTPQLTGDAIDDLKRLSWLTNQIFIQGDWMLLPTQRTAPAETVKVNKSKPRRK